MPSTLPPAHRRRARLLYVGVAIFVLLAALTARSVWRAWRQHAGQARTAAVFALVQQRMPSRPIEAPGAMAWLREQLSTYRGHLGPGDASAFERLAEETERIPAELAGVAALMRRAASAVAPEPQPLAAAPFHPPGSSRRMVSMIEAHGHSFVVTRRHALERDASSNEFVSRLVGTMATARAGIDGAVNGIARPVRLYAFAEDGTLLSLPWSSVGAAGRETAHSEALQLSSRPTLPSFAPEEFFFRFGEGEEDAVRYSGFYVDLGGRGLVSTLTTPIDGIAQSGILALDLTHEVDWEHFASTIPGPLAAAIVRTRSERPATWAALQSDLRADAPVALKNALDDVVRRDGGKPGEISPMTHAVVPDIGAVAAFHVAERAWLLTFFPRLSPSFPTGAVALLGVVLAILLAGFEVNRRRAERQAERAERALGEKQNLLNTMQVPLVVVDPNTDEIVSANLVAESIGIRRGARFADRVAADPRAREHYERTQVATSEARRAYGVPIKVESGAGGATDRFAIVRSVAVTAPIEALAADERHRLAILFLIDPASDLRLLLEDAEAAAHRDERRRLGGLLSHGLDTLAEVLRRSVARIAPGGSAGAWLAEYLQRRIHVTAWLLDHWDQPPPPHDSVVDAAQAHETLTVLDRIFQEVRRDAELRVRLGWANGPLSAGGDGPAFAAAIDWPAEFEMTIPVRGGLGFFLTEVLSNAMRHGAAGSIPRLSVRCDRVRHELAFVAENERRDDRPAAGAAYGGLALLAGMARLFGWREFTAAADGSRFVVTWCAPLTRRDRPGTPD